MKEKLEKLLVILGPTASGKSDLALHLAKKFKGEIIAADSRTIYKEMDIGTAKPFGKKRGNVVVVDGIPHYCLDLVRPDKTLTLAQFKSKAMRAIRSVLKKKKLPVLVGGTGLYIQAIVDNLSIPKVPPQSKLREELEKKSPAELYQLLEATDPEAAKNIGRHNARRMIRAIEVLTISGVPFSKATKKGKKIFDALLIGPKVERDELYRRIDHRVDAMMREGFLEEVLALRKKLYAPTLPSMSGIGYGELNAHVDGLIGLDEAVQRIKFRTHQYARRQMTWFRRVPDIYWVSSQSEAARLINKWKINKET